MHARPEESQLAKAASLRGASGKPSTWFQLGDTYRSIFFSSNFACVAIHMCFIVLLGCPRPQNFHKFQYLILSNEHLLKTLCYNRAYYITAVCFCHLKSKPRQKRLLKIQIHSSIFLETSPEIEKHFYELVAER
jgi:hypothetical protein